MPDTSVCTGGIRKQNPRGCHCTQQTHRLPEHSILLNTVEMVTQIIIFYFVSLLRLISTTKRFHPSLLDNIRTIADQNFAVRHDRQSKVKTLSDFSDCSERFTYYRKLYSLSFYY